MELQDLNTLPFNINITTMAKSQVRLMLEQDFTLKDHHLRIVINGKGCNGFTYAVQFAVIENEDVEVNLEDGIKLLMDSFTAQFVKRGTIDFIQTHLEEGFQFTNSDENLFHGKFFKTLKL